MSASDWVHLAFDEVLRETERALLVRLSDGEEVWLPLNQIADPDDYQVGDRDGEISITAWLAREKGLGE
jgi:hypothetical protein